MRMNLGPGYEHREWLFDRIEGFSVRGVLDTESKLDPAVPNQMKHLGADLYVPCNMQAFDIVVEEVPGLRIAAIEVNYLAGKDDFVISKLVLDGSPTNGNVSQSGKGPIDIDGGTLTRLPLERYKRKVISSWVLQDGGPEDEPRWHSWDNGAYLYGGASHSRGGDEWDLKKVARVYVSSRYGNADAHEMVAKALGVSKSTAGRWIKKARDAGYIERIAPQPLRYDGMG
ncbi:helix-turn-helix domain-containing protein [Bifidobacterium miconisargentati]|uniref:helix-turn-helix domain-containing protein n=1 Tax=Bifidobacterium miconisargentati TaxID=2834437 RepID=UPI001BDD8799|nr:helix-turn-helix domain-containing protein [Bifidobacterium miconisargentati]MBW3090012.1 hypothetical protein [Bifidobacterium miconisargentati]